MNTTRNQVANQVKDQIQPGNLIVIYGLAGYPFNGQAVTVKTVTDKQFLVETKDGLDYMQSFASLITGIHLLRVTVELLPNPASEKIKEAAQATDEAQTEVIRAHRRFKEALRLESEEVKGALGSPLTVDEMADFDDVELQLYPEKDDWQHGTNEKAIRLIKAILREVACEVYEESIS